MENKENKGLTYYEKEAIRKAELNEPRLKKTKKIMKIILLIGFILFIGSIVKYCNSSSYKKEDLKMERVKTAKMVFWAGFEICKNKLNYPDEATLQMGGVRRLNPYWYQVYSKIQSKNAFGVKETFSFFTTFRIQDSVEMKKYFLTLKRALGLLILT